MRAGVRALREGGEVLRQELISFDAFAGLANLTFATGRMISEILPTSLAADTAGIRGVKVGQEVAALIGFAMVAIPTAMVGMAEGIGVFRDLFGAIVGGVAFHVHFIIGVAVGAIAVLLGAIVQDVLSLILIELAAVVVRVFGAPCGQNHN